MTSLSSPLPSSGVIAPVLPASVQVARHPTPSEYIASLVGEILREQEGV